MAFEVISHIVPKNSGNFPVAMVSHIRGAYFSVASTGEMNNIPLLMRSTGMLIHVRDSNVDYRLVGGTLNTNWHREPSRGSAVFSQVAATSWLYTHDLGYNPGVRIMHVSGYEIEGQVTYPSSGSIIRVDFNRAVAGTGYLF